MGAARLETLLEGEITSAEAWLLQGQRQLRAVSGHAADGELSESVIDRRDGVEGTSPTMQRCLFFPVSLVLLRTQCLSAASWHT